MKYIWGVTFVAMLIGGLIFSGCDPAYACDRGCTEMPNSNVCACDAPAGSGEKQPEYVKPSDEKPRQNQTPLWAVDEVKVDAAKRGKEAKDGGWTPVSAPTVNPNPDLLPGDDAAPAGKNP